MTDYPYMLSNNKIKPIIEQLQKAERPQRFTQAFLSQMGFTSTNDRAFIPLFKKLGFLGESGTPTSLYDSLKDRTTSKKALAKQIRELYAELFAINTEIYNASPDDIKGAISRTSGKDEEGVNRAYNTFKALCSEADFSLDLTPNEANNSESLITESSHNTSVPIKSNEFHYNIQIHLPATNDISVFNAIFKSLKENLLM